MLSAVLMAPSASSSPALFVDEVRVAFRAIGEGQ